MFYDLADNPTPSFAITLSAGVPYVFAIRIDCRSNLSLKSESVSDLLVEGRLLGDVSWTNLESSEIDLTAYAGTRRSFEIQLTPAADINVSKAFRLYTE